MSNILTSIEKYGKWIASALFLSYFIMGLLIYTDYGMDYDEVRERENTTITLNGALGHKLTQNDLPDGVSVLPYLYTYPERFYGTFLQMPIALLEYFRHYTIDTSRVFQLRNLWTFLNYFLASICMFEIIRKRFTKWRYAILALLLLILTPRLFADSFYNIKDSMFFSWFSIALFFLQRMSLNEDLKDLICFSVSAAVATNLRMVGGLLLFPAVALYLFKWSAKSTSARKAWISITAIALLFFVVFILITPASWKNPLQHLIGSLSFFSDYSIAANNIVVYLGKHVGISDLPWHYLPVWISVTTPLFYLLFFIVGVAWVVADWLKKVTDSFTQSFMDLVFIYVFFVPILLAILMHSSLYNGWRHFYFTYSAMLFFMIYAFVRIEEQRKRTLSVISGLLVLISCMNTGQWMVRNHPYQMVYFNQLVRGKAQNLFERDYYALTTRDCLKFILDSDSNLSINVWDYDAGAGVIIWDLPAQERERLHISSTGNNEPADYIVLNYHHVIGNEFSFPFYQPVRHIMVDGMKLATVFQRDHSNEIAGYDIVSRITANTAEDSIENVIDNDYLSAWSNGTPQNAEDEITITLNGVYELYGMTFYQGAYGTEYPRSLLIEYSDDEGQTWHIADIRQRQGLECAFTPVRCNMLRLRNTEASEHSWSFAELMFYGASE